MARPSKIIPLLSESDKLRFFVKISTVPTEKGCLEWTAVKIQKGYGLFRLGGRKHLAHRLAYFLATGTDPGNHLVCHSCDNPSCCAPSHLWLGTYSDNALDREQKQRGNSPRGDDHYSRTRPELLSRGERPRVCPVASGVHRNAKLTPDVFPIIQADTRSQRLIAVEHGVSRATISRVQRRAV